MKTYLIILLTALLSIPLSARAGSGDVDVKTIVLEHIADNYEWHIGTFGDKHVAVPLPVIVHSEERGWMCFSSDLLYHGAEHESFFIAEEGEYEGKIVERMSDGTIVRPLDFSITKTVAGLLINSAIVIALTLYVASKYRKRKPNSPAPKGIVGAFEMLVESLLNDIIKPCVGATYRKFAPFILTLFVFIFINNLMGLIPIFPAGTNVTGNISVTLVLAVVTCIVINIFGSKHYWKDILWPDVPTWLKVPLPLMPLIEVVGIFTKPFALMIRLFANIVAGHSVILILTCMVFVTAEMGAAVSGSMTVVSVLLGVFMNCLELLVAFLQAYVFAMLSSVFIGLSQEGKEHEKEANISIHK